MLTAMTVHCDVLVLCEVHVEVVKKSVLLFQKVSQLIGLTAAVHATCLYKTSRRDTMVREPRQVVLPQDRDVLCRDKTKCVLRPRRLDQDHIPVFVMFC